MERGSIRDSTINSQIAGKYIRVSSQEIGKSNNPLDDFYHGYGGAIHPKTINIRPLQTRDKENKHHSGAYVY